MGATARASTGRSRTYLTYLRVERGLADATIRAYRSDLTDFAMSRGAARDWADGPEVAQRYLAARARRGRPGDPGLAPTSLRRRTASIRGFYRFAYGDGLIATDVAAHIDLPRQPRLLPETLTVDEVDRLLEAAGERRRDGRAAAPTADGIACATGRCSSCCTRPGCASRRRSASTARTCRATRATVRVIGKGDRERVVPVGDVALEWLDRYLAWPRRRGSPAPGSRDGAGDAAVRHAARGAAGAPGGVARR